MKKTTFITLAAAFIFAAGCQSGVKDHTTGNPFDYTSYGRLTDPGKHEEMLTSLPDDLDRMCDIANVQLTHITMLSQWKIPRSEWKLASACHDIEDILDTLSVKGDGTLNADRELNDRILGACTKESIFSTSMLRAKGIPARIRVGYLTNLYSGEKALEFWRNVNRYSRDVPADSAEFDQYTLYMKEVNKAIEHWVTEYRDAETGSWRVLDIRPEYLWSYGLEVDYHLPDAYFEFAWEAWQTINDPGFQNDAYSEGGLDGRSHIRYQMLLDFYSLLNHEIPGVFDDRGHSLPAGETNPVLNFIRKPCAGLSPEEINELNALAALLSRQPSVDEMLEFYERSETLKIETMLQDPYSFVSRKAQGS